ncbi:hypothetical protein [Nocardiopsis suaedae]|uniref:Uncharacterized protein n=1 Tax=Nocardiopsis suaedae TaxID=3018444 RepID=A0ABT4TJF4_9ACTN|nr:hypothetical protein [Nocardiopsis suaedae]MDA2804802.1 hypothetical protein [Nocardiopsis suaedae]
MPGVLLGQGSGGGAARERRACGEEVGAQSAPHDRSPEAVAALPGAVPGQA